MFIPDDADIKARGLCYYHQKGTCTKGNDCKWEHSYAKKKKAQSKTSSVYSGSSGSGSQEQNGRKKKGYGYQRWSNPSQGHPMHPLCQKCLYSWSKLSFWTWIKSSYSTHGEKPENTQRIGGRKREVNHLLIPQDPVVLKVQAPGEAVMQLPLPKPRRQKVQRRRSAAAGSSSACLCSLAPG